MPEWARPTDVAFDHELAQGAIESVAALRFVLGVSWDTQHDAAQAALARWFGASADGFGVALRTLLRELGQVQRGLHELQSALESAMDDARSEQRRVVQLQALWDRQEAAEQAALLVGSSS